MTACQGIPQSIGLSSSVQHLLGKHLLSCYPQEPAEYCWVLPQRAACVSAAICRYAT